MGQPDLIPMIVVVGPTASGKTRLAVEIALRYGGEVVSADSMQIYRGMNIGTAKPTREEMRGVPHHMIDIAEPWEDYSVAQYVSEAAGVISDIRSRGKLPVLAGGTGLYISSLTQNLSFGETIRDDALRESLRKEAESLGGKVLLERLAALDPETASKLHPNNLGRIIRAIEVAEVSGITMTELQRRSHSRPPAYRCCKIGLSFADRAELYGRINRRVGAMFEAGLLKEAEKLLETPGVKDSTAMQAIGYKELLRYLSGGIPLEEAAELIRRETRRYAKRQLTWFRRDKEIRWVEAGRPWEIISAQVFDIIDKCGLL